jgi:O-methyltransferase
MVGDYYEFGLYQGHTFCVVQAAAEDLGFRDMQFFGFDSFEGLPPLRGSDVGSVEFSEGDYECSYDRVVEHLDKYGVDWKRTHLVKGWYDDLPASADECVPLMRGAALVLVDCDLYESTVPVLNFIAPYLRPGTIVMFDDWDSFNSSDDMGERRAFREFLEANPEWTAQPIFTFGPPDMLSEGGQVFRLSRDEASA